MKNSTKKTLCSSIINGAVIAAFIGASVANAAWDMPFEGTNKGDAIAKVVTQGAGEASGDADFTLGMTMTGEGSGGADMKNGWTGYSNGTTNNGLSYAGDTTDNSKTDGAARSNGIGNGAMNDKSDGAGSAQGAGSISFNMTFKARGTSAVQNEINSSANMMSNDIFASVRK